MSTINALFPNPVELFATPPAKASATANASNSGTNSDAATPNNQLTPDSFITLLTTQLQAQDPLNPIDPTQMVSELTSMNTFEQLLQIRQDMDTLVGAANLAAGGSPHASFNPSSAAIAQANQAALAKMLPSSFVPPVLPSANFKFSQF